MHYEPITWFQKILVKTQYWPGYLGRTSYRKLSRRYSRRAVVDFNKVVSTIGPGDICIDLGANFGLYTRMLAETGATVHAFEPDPDNFGTLKKNTEMFDNVVLHQSAVGTVTEQVLFYRAKGYNQLSGKRANASSIYYNERSMDNKSEMLVEQIDFIQFLNELGSTVKVVKMDIEGAEWGIVSAMMDKGSLENIEYMFVETHESMDIKRIPLARKFRQMARDTPKPYINFYWP